MTRDPKPASVRFVQEVLSFFHGNYDVELVRAAAFRVDELRQEDFFHLRQQLARAEAKALPPASQTRFVRFLGWLIRILRRLEEKVTHSK